MLKGAVALVVRYVLYFAGAGLVGAGAALYGTDGTLCLDIKQTAEIAGDAVQVALIGGGSAVFAGTTIWSRIAKKLGGTT